VGHLAAASCESQPVFCGRRGILTSCFLLQVFAVPNARFGNCCIGARMKKKKRRQPARREAHAVHAKLRESVKQEEVEPASTAWLRMVPNGVEDDPSANTSRGRLPLRNGKRQPRDLDLYTPEHNPRNR
jgi:hypothetical protein